MLFENMHINQIGNNQELIKFASHLQKQKGKKHTHKLINVYEKIVKRWFANLPVKSAISGGGKFLIVKSIFFYWF